MEEGYEVFEDEVPISDAITSLQSMTAPAEITVAPITVAPISTAPLVTTPTTDRLPEGQSTSSASTSPVVVVQTVPPSSTSSTSSPEEIQPSTFSILSSEAIVTPPTTTTTTTAAVPLEGGGLKANEENTTVDVLHQTPRQIETTPASNVIAKLQRKEETIHKHTETLRSLQLDNEAKATSIRDLKLALQAEYASVDGIRQEMLIQESILRDVQQELLTLQTCAHETKTLTHADAYKEPNEKEQRAAIKEMEQVHQLSIQKLQADYEEKISKVGELERTNAELVRMSAMLHLKKEEIEKELLSYKSAATGSAKASYEALSNDASELAEAVVKSQIALETKSRESKFNMTIDDLREQLRISSEEKDKLLMEISVNKMKTEGVDAFVAQNPVTPPQPGWFAKEHERRKELEEEKSVIIQNIQKENIAELEEKCKELERMNDELLRQHVVHQRVWTELRANPTISDFLGPSVEGDSSDFPPTTTTMHKTSTDRELEQFVAKRVSMYETCISSVDSLLQQKRHSTLTSSSVNRGDSLKQLAKELLAGILTDGGVRSSTEMKNDHRGEMDVDDPGHDSKDTTAGGGDSARVARQRRASLMMSENEMTNVLASEGINGMRLLNINYEGNQTHWNPKSLAAYKKLWILCQSLWLECLRLTRWEWNDAKPALLHRAQERQMHKLTTRRLSQDSALTKSYRMVLKTLLVGRFMQDHRNRKVLMQVADKIRQSARDTYYENAPVLKAADPLSTNAEWEHLMEWAKKERSAQLRSDEESREAGERKSQRTVSEKIPEGCSSNKEPERNFSNGFGAFVMKGEKNVSWSKDLPHDAPELVNTKNDCILLRQIGMLDKPLTEPVEKYEKSNRPQSFSILSSPRALENPAGDAKSPRTADSPSKSAPVIASAPPLERSDYIAGIKRTISLKRNPSTTGQSTRKLPSFSDIVGVCDQEVDRLLVMCQHLTKGLARWRGVADHLFSILVELAAEKTNILNQMKQSKEAEAKASKELARLDDLKHTDELKSEQEMLTRRMLVAQRDHRAVTLLEKARSLQNQVKVLEGKKKGLEMNVKELVLIHQNISVPRKPYHIHLTSAAQKQETEEEENSISSSKAQRSIKGAFAFASNYLHAQGLLPTVDADDALSMVEHRHVMDKNSPSSAGVGKASKFEMMMSGKTTVLNSFPRPDNAVHEIRKKLTSNDPATGERTQMFAKHLSGRGNVPTSMEGSPTGILYPTHKDCNFRPPFSPCVPPKRPHSGNVHTRRGVTIRARAVKDVPDAGMGQIREPHWHGPPEVLGARIPVPIHSKHFAGVGGWIETSESSSAGNISLSDDADEYGVYEMSHSGSAHDYFPKTRLTLHSSYSLDHQQRAYQYPSNHSVDILANARAKRSNVVGVIKEEEVVQRDSNVAQIDRAYSGDDDDDVDEAFEQDEGEMYTYYSDDESVVKYRAHNIPRNYRYADDSSSETLKNSNDLGLTSSVVGAYSPPVSVETSIIALQPYEVRHDAVSQQKASHVVDIYKPLHLRTLLQRSEQNEKLLLHPEVLKKGVHVKVADIDTGVREAPRYADIVSTLQTPVQSQDAKEILGALGVLNSRKARKLQKLQVDKERREQQRLKETQMSVEHYRE